jgi:hypothetical protein
MKTQIVTTHSIIIIFPLPNLPLRGEGGGERLQEQKTIWHPVNDMTLHRIYGVEYPPRRCAVYVLTI